MFSYFDSLTAQATAIKTQIQESSVSNALSHLAQAGYSLAKNETETCENCGAIVSKGQSALGMKVFEKCSVCLKSCCGKCISKMSEPLPDLVKHQEVRGENTLDWVCNKCDSIVVLAIMREFKKAFSGAVVELLDRFVSGQEEFRMFHSLPGPVEDTMKRKIYRMSQVADIIVDYAGLSSLKYAYKTIKYAYMGKELYTILIGADFLKVIGPVASAMSEIVAKELGAKGILHMYYLSCKHKLNLKIYPPIPGSLGGSSDGMLNESCPLELLDHVGQYVDCALWLYACKLPAPHNTNEWSAWYLSQLIRHQNWTLLCCKDEAAQLRNQKKSPAFALAVRKISATHKEAIIVIRGSASALDWSINMNEAPVGFSYRGGAFGENPCRGHVHAGMLEGAKAILEDHGLLESLIDFVLNKQYRLRVIGHSLGAGVAILLAAELKNTLWNLLKTNLPDNIITTTADSPFAILTPEYLSAVAFASPPCVCETLSDAIALDGLCLTVVNCQDIVPRFSRVNVLRLVAEVKECSDEADRWYGEDLEALRAYITSIGRAKDIGAAHVSSAKANVAEVMVAVPMEEEHSSDLAGSQHAELLEGNVETQATSAPVLQVGVDLPPRTLEALNHLTFAANAISQQVPESEAKYQSEKPTAIETDGGSPPSLRVDIRLVPPGRIIYLHEESGVLEASLVSHRHETFRRMLLIVDKNLEDHKLVDHFRKLKNVRRKRRYFQLLSNSAEGTLAANAGSYLSLSIGLRSPPQWQSIRLDHNEVGDSGVTKSLQVLRSSCEVSDAWVKCCVCTMDTTWANVLKSDGSRSHNGHNCRSCGRVVCSLCSPAGDKLLGDGVKDTIQIPDWRIALPELGIWDPQRVCLHCFFDSYRGLSDS